jgi:hypothetical protein
MATKNTSRQQARNDEDGEPVSSLTICLVGPLPPCPRSSKWLLVGGVGGVVGRFADAHPPDVAQDWRVA